MDDRTRKARCEECFLFMEVERKIRQRMEELRTCKPADREQLLQELQVHQIELELQNEELRQVQGQLEFARQQYFNLYNEAPVGYASLDDAGLILRANDTLAHLLGMEQEDMFGQALVEFMEPQDRDLFRGRFKAFARNPTNKHIDVRFRRRAGNECASGFVGRIQGRRIAANESAHGGRRRIGWEETLLVVVSDVTVLKQSEEQIHFQAFHDALTGLPNRANLYDRLETALALSRRYHRYGALLFMDMDRFKYVNDSLGHQAGDQLLVKFAERLRKYMRREDLLVRMGGDEFVILLSEQDTSSRAMASKAQHFAKHIIEPLIEPFTVLGHDIQMSVSVGITVYPFQPNDGVHDVVRQADTAMYQAKGSGHNQLRFFQPAMQEEVRRKLELETELRVACAEKQFEVHYQPQVTPDGRIRAVEALLRWQHPKRGLVLPSEFIPTAEETGLILPLGDLVLEQVSAQIAEWCALGLLAADTEIAVNVSSRQLQSKRFSTRVEEIFARHQTEPKRLVLEITESLLLPDDHVCHAVLEQLAQLGLCFSVDDFGTGYSSLAVLRKAPVGQIKIDREFVLNLDVETTEKASTRRDLALVRAITCMAKDLGMTIVVEGVETEQQRRVFAKLGCDLMQGWLFSPAVPVGEMTRLFERGWLGNVAMT